MRHRKGVGPYLNRQETNGRLLEGNIGSGGSDEGIAGGDDDGNYDSPSDDPGRDSSRFNGGGGGGGGSDPTRRQQRRAIREGVPVSDIVDRETGGRSSFDPGEVTVDDPEFQQRRAFREGVDAPDVTTDIDAQVPQAGRGTELGNAGDPVAIDEVPVVGDAVETIDRVGDFVRSGPDEASVGDPGFSDPGSVEAEVPNATDGFGQVSDPVGDGRDPPDDPVRRVEAGLDNAARTLDREFLGPAGEGVGETAAEVSVLPDVEQRVTGTNYSERFIESGGENLAAAANVPALARDVVRAGDIAVRGPDRELTADDFAPRADALAEGAEADTTAELEEAQADLPETRGEFAAEAGAATATRTADALRENPAETTGALAGGAVGGVIFGSAASRALEIGTTRFRAGIEGRRGPDIDAEDTTDQVARVEAGEQPTFETDTGAPGEMAVDEFERRAADNPQELIDAVDSDQVTFRSEADRLPDDLEAQRGSYELSGLFTSGDFAPLRFNQRGGGLFSDAEVRPPRIFGEPERASAFETPEVESMPSRAQGAGYAVEVDGEVVESGFPPTQRAAGAAEDLADELGGERIPDPNTAGDQFLREDADRGTAFVRPGGSRTPEFEAIFPPGSRFERVETGTITARGTRGTLDVFRRIDDQPDAPNADEIADGARRADRETFTAEEISDRLSRGGVPESTPVAPTPATPTPGLSPSTAASSTPPIAQGGPFDTGLGADLDRTRRTTPPRRDRDGTTTPRDTDDGRSRTPTDTDPSPRTPAPTTPTPTGMFGTTPSLVSDFPPLTPRGVDPIETPTTPTPTSSPPPATTTPPTTTPRSPTTSSPPTTARSPPPTSGGSPPTTTGPGPTRPPASSTPGSPGSGGGRSVNTPASSGPSSPAGTTPGTPDAPRRRELPDREDDPDRERRPVEELPPETPGFGNPVVSGIGDIFGGFGREARRSRDATPGVDAAETGTRDALEEVFGRFGF